MANDLVLITGADGFIGSHLVEHMVRAGKNVRAFVYYNSFGNWGWLENVSADVLSQVEIIAGDIRDSDRVYEAVRGCSQVMHLAALIAIPYSYSSPRSYVDTNITGTLNVLQAAKNLDVERVLSTSTSEVYGTAQYAPIDEEHPLQGQSPYSASKIGADKMCESFYRSFDLPVVTVRPFNTYGPRQSARAVIPTIITQLLEGQRVIKLGDLSPKRDFNYVQDTVSGFSEILNAAGVIGETINIASGKEYSIREVVDFLVEEINPNAEIIEDQARIRPEKSEVFRLIGCNKKIQSLTSWQANYDINEGLKKTVDWFRDDKNRQLYKESLYNI